MAWCEAACGLMAINLTMKEQINRPDERCFECGAHFPPGGACRDHLDAVLALETQLAHERADVWDRLGAVTHFYAVGSYMLQHPEGMGGTLAALHGLRTQLARHLDGLDDMDAIAARVRSEANGAARVTRRNSDPIPTWGIGDWPVSIIDVLAAGLDGYCDAVGIWIQSVRRELDARAPLQT